MTKLIFAFRKFAKSVYRNINEGVCISHEEVLQRGAVVSFRNKEMVGDDEMFEA